MPLNAPELQIASMMTHAHKPTSANKAPAPAVPDSIRYEQSVFKAGTTSSTRPLFSFQPKEWESVAKKCLSANSWGYLHGNCGVGSTYEKNLAAFNRWSIIPRRLVPSQRDSDGTELFSDTSTTVLGEKLPIPMAIAPIGVQKIFNEQAEPATARAAASLKVPYILSSASSTSIEHVAEENGAGSPRWFQLYWPSRKNDDITISLLKRAKENGYTALFVTLDTYVLGWRPSDLDNGYNPFLHPDQIGVEIGLTDPVYQKKFKEEHGYEIGNSRDTLGLDVIGKASREWSSVIFPGHSNTWEDIAFLKKHWDGPIVLKGIQSVTDAKKCVEVGVQGIVVSNHGGRQMDGGVSSLGMLPKIAAAVGDKLDVFFDSGIRCGADIIKALALGAKCVLVGRPYAYGLALGGEEGVKHILKSISGDVLLNLHLAGLRNLDEVTSDILVREDELF